MLLLRNAEPPVVSAHRLGIIQHKRERNNQYV